MANIIWNTVRCPYHNTLHIEGADCPECAQAEIEYEQELAAYEREHPEVMKQEQQ